MSCTKGGGGGRGTAIQLSLVMTSSRDKTMSCDLCGGLVMQAVGANRGGYPQSRTRHVCALPDTGNRRSARKPVGSLKGLELKVDPNTVRNFREGKGLPNIVKYCPWDRALNNKLVAHFLFNCYQTSYTACSTYCLHVHSTFSIESATLFVTLKGCLSRMPTVHVTTRDCPVESLYMSR